MVLSTNELKELHELACAAAKQAGRLVAEYRHSTDSISRQRKEAGDTPASQIVTDVDYQAEALITEQLLPSMDKFDLALLSEETPDDLQRLTKDYFWCVDPIDGTLAFTESRAGYSVSIALIAKDGTPVVGAVFDPLTQDLYSALRGFGAYKNNSLIKTPTNSAKNTLTIPCDQSLSTHKSFQSFYSDIQQETKTLGYADIELIIGQGAVMNAITVIEHSPAIYFKLPKKTAGGGSIWDFAATACIFKELGLVVSDFHGEKLELNRADTTFMNEKGIFFSSDHLLPALIHKVTNRY